MVATAAGNRLEEIARDLFEVVRHFALSGPRGRRRDGDLKDVEFQTLAILHERGSMIVGDIQRLLGVLPAQMSRVIRSLEDRPGPFIACRINPRDKRKIDVTLTDAGARALHAYQATRVRRIAHLLHELSEDDQANLVHLLDRIRGLMDRCR
jgi:DNA-binding MarR family transcriptional regulator